jgi:hypothetical protein
MGHDGSATLIFITVVQFFLSLTDEGLTRKKSNQTDGQARKAHRALVRYYGLRIFWLRQTRTSCAPFLKASLLGKGQRGKPFSPLPDVGWFREKLSVFCDEGRKNFPFKLPSLG